MSALNKFYKNVNNDIVKFSRTFVSVITPSINNHSDSNIKVYSHKNKSLHDDWKNIKNDYTRIGNDIRKDIKSYAR